MNWSIDMASDTPPSRQLVERALDAIAVGRLGPGDRLPSVRSLAAEALVNANTVAKAYRDLERMGAAQGENGRGVFVTSKAPGLAREARSASTLTAYRRALAEALRAGHAAAALQEILLNEGARKTA